MIFFALLVTLLALFAGCLHGGREAYHADSTIFEKRWNVAKTSFWGSYSWLRKYVDYDSDKKKNYGTRQFLTFGMFRPGPGKCF